MSFERYDGPIYLPTQIYKLSSQDAMKALKAYNTKALTRFQKRNVRNSDVVEELQDNPPEPSVPDSGLFELPESDLNIPEDPILDFVNSQCHSPEGVGMCIIQYRGIPFMWTGEEYMRILLQLLVCGFTKNTHVHETRPTFQWSCISI